MNQVINPPTDLYLPTEVPDINFQIDSVMIIVSDYQLPPIHLMISKSYPNLPIVKSDTEYYTGMYIHIHLFYDYFPRSTLESLIDTILSLEMSGVPELMM